MIRFAMIFFAIYGAMSGAAFRYVIDNETQKMASILVDISMQQLTEINIESI